MNIQVAFMVKLILLLSLVPCIAQCNASEIKDNYPPLEINGTYYANACQLGANESLHKTVLARNVENSNYVWQIINALLCGSFNSSAHELVKTIVPQQIREKVVSTGEEPSFRILRRNDDVIKDLMANGRAWGVEMRVTSESLVLEYYPNDACFRRIALENHNSKWNISEIGEACD